MMLLLLEQAGAASFGLDLNSLQSCIAFLVSEQQRQGRAMDAIVTRCSRLEEKMEECDRKVSWHHRALTCSGEVSVLRPVSLAQVRISERQMMEAVDAEHALRARTSAVEDSLVKADENVSACRNCVHSYLLSIYHSFAVLQLFPPLSVMNKLQHRLGCWRRCCEN